MELQNLLGFLLPPVIDLVNTKVENAKARYWVAMFICFAIGILLNLDKVNNLEALLGNAAIVFTTAQITYKTYWEKSDAREVMVDKMGGK